MRIRLTWIAAILALVSIGVVMACSTKYSSSNNGLLVVPSQGGVAIDGQGGPVMETFSLDLANGHLSEINNVNGPPVDGLPQALVLDPAGAFAYVLIYQNVVVPDSVTGIEAFPVASDGKLGTGTTTVLNPSTTATALCVFTQNGQTVTQDIPVTVNAPVVPTAIAIDSAGKFLFVADLSTSAPATYMCNGVPVTATVPVPGAVSVFAVSAGTLTEVAGSPFQLPAESGSGTPNASALAVTPTVYPPLYAPCAGFTPPTTEDLYVTDSINYVVLNYAVDPSAGTLTLRPVAGVPGVPTGPVPSGVTVDPCNRFAYVSNAGSGNGANSVSAFTMCSTILLPNCQTADYSLLPVKGSPFVISPGDGPGPLAVDAYGNFLYVVDTASGILSCFKISATTGSLLPLTPSSVSAGPGANSIAIRSDDSWMFVANIGSQTVSEYGITPHTGELTPQPPVSTFNYPSGVAVK